MLELLFREAEALVRKGYVPAASGRIPVDGSIVKPVMTEAIKELKARLRANHTGLDYTNSLLHLASDELTTERIAAPFWEIVTDPKWAVVDQEMKEAFDRLDHGHDDAFTHATDALESTIKIISDEKGWTRGNETGAAGYIDNLVSTPERPLHRGVGGRGAESHLRQTTQSSQTRWRQQPPRPSLGRPADLGDRELHELDQEPGPTDTPREARPTMTDHPALRDPKRATLGALAALLILAATCPCSNFHKPEKCW
jgi:hypothetical protein